MFHFRNYNQQYNQGNNNSFFVFLSHMVSTAHHRLQTLTGRMGLGELSSLQCGLYAVKTNCGSAIFVFLHGIYIVGLAHGRRHELVERVVDVLVFDAVLQAGLEGVHDSNLEVGVEKPIR